MPLAIGVPLGAQGPVRYDSTGMYCSFACAKADVLTREETPAASRVAARASLRIFMVVSVIEVGKARSGKGAASTRSERAWGSASRRRAAPSRLGPPWGAEACGSEPACAGLDRLEERPRLAAAGASTRSERAWGSASRRRAAPSRLGPPWGAASTRSERAWGSASRRRAAPSRLGPPWGAASTRSERAWGSCSSVREGPKPELLLGCGPKFGQAMRLDDQEPHDQAAKDHQLGVRGRGGADVAPDQAGQEGQELVQRNRQDHDEGRAEEAAHDRTQPADDHHEQQLERQVHRERARRPGRRRPTAHRPRR